MSTPNEKAPPATTGSAKSESVTGQSVPFTPDVRKVYEIVSRARRYAPTPPPMVVLADGSEVAL